MAQGAANGRLTRELEDDVCASGKVAKKSQQKSAKRRSIAEEASNVSATFGCRLDERMHAYSGVMNEFGGPGNMVDHWRVQFTGLRAANARGNRKI